MYPAREMSIQYPSVQDDNVQSFLPPEPGVPNNNNRQTGVVKPGHTSGLKEV